MNSPLNRDSLIQALAKAVPGFKANVDWVEESLLYPIANDFARFICDQADRQNDQVLMATAFLERGLEEGDLIVRDLVHECLETLASCPAISEIKKHFGERTLLLWKEHFEI